MVRIRDADQGSDLELMFVGDGDGNRTMLEQPSSEPLVWARNFIYQVWWLTSEVVVSKTKSAMLESLAAGQGIGINILSSGSVPGQSEGT